MAVDGAVHFWGLVASDAQRETLKAAADGGIRGVRKMVNYMVDTTMIKA